MASYSFTGDDGHEYAFEAPDDMAVEDAYQQAEQTYKAQSTHGRFEEIRNALQNGEDIPRRTMQAWPGGEQQPVDAGDWQHRFGQGVADIGQGITQLGAHAVDLLAGTNTSQGIDESLRQQEAQYQSPEGFDWARLGGNIAGGAFLPGGTSLRGMVGAGALGGAVTPVENTEDFWTTKGQQAGTGALLGAVLKGILPNTSVSDEAAMLMKEGVHPTVGQTVGGWANTAEQKATSIPLTGDAILHARQLARDQFNRASINRVYKELGEEMPDLGKIAGHDVIDAAHQRVTQAYSSAMDGVAPDITPRALRRGAIVRDSRMQDIFSTMADDDIQKFNHLIQKFDPNKTPFKTIDSSLGTMAKRYANSSLATDKSIGDALRTYQTIGRERLANLVPEAGEKLSRANAAYGELMRLENAASRAGLHEGIFTPGQLVNASKQGAYTRSQFARGVAPMQEWAQAGQKVLGDVYPDSGTPGRILQSALLGGGGIALGGMPTAGAMAAGAVMYSPAVQELIVKYLQLGHPLTDAIKLALAKGGQEGMKTGMENLMNGRFSQ